MLPCPSFEIFIRLLDSSFMRAGKVLERVGESQKLEIREPACEKKQRGCQHEERGSQRGEKQGPQRDHGGAGHRKQRESDDGSGDETRWELGKDATGYMRIKILKRYRVVLAVRATHCLSRTSTSRASERRNHVQIFLMKVI